MIEFQPSVIYTFEDLAALLAPAGLDAGELLLRLRPRAIGANAWSGVDLIAALQAGRNSARPALNPALVADAVYKFGGATQAARALGVCRMTVYRKLAQLDQPRRPRRKRRRV